MNLFNFFHGSRPAPATGAVGAIAGRPLSPGTGGGLQPRSATPGASFSDSLSTMLSDRAPSFGLRQFMGIPGGPASNGGGTPGNAIGVLQGQGTGAGGGIQPTPQSGNVGHIVGAAQGFAQQAGLPDTGTFSGVPGGNVGGFQPAPPTGSVGHIVGAGQQFAQQAGIPTTGSMQGVLPSGASSGFSPAPQPSAPASGFSAVGGGPVHPGMTGFPSGTGSMPPGGILGTLMGQPGSPSSGGFQRRPLGIAGALLNQPDQQQPGGFRPRPSFQADF